MSPSQPPKGAKDLARLILTLHPLLGRVVRAEIRRSTGKKPLTLPQYRVLEEIHHGNQHLGNLSKKHGISQPAMSKLVEAVVQNGYVERSEDLADRRQSRLKLTPLGQKIFERAHRLAILAMTKKLKELKATDLAFIYDAFEKLSQIFDTIK